MAELRAPDPTLDALGEYSDVIVQRGATPQRAHTAEPLAAGTDHQSRCGLRAFVVTPAEEARWFAVPCRECFPDAPPSGYSLQDDSCGDGCNYRSYAPDPNLAWQVRA